VVLLRLVLRGDGRRAREVSRGPLLDELIAIVVVDLGHKRRPRQLGARQLRSCERPHGDDEHDAERNEANLPGSQRAKVFGKTSSRNQNAPPLAGPL
jgi:hypothetical protein